MLQTLLSPAQACGLMMSYLLPSPFETAPLPQAYGRILSKSLYNKIPQPPFDKSAMDGYAYAAPSLPFTGELQLAEGLIAAGDASPLPVAEGFCRSIMTGAPVPQGADAVHRVEFAESFQKNGASFVRFTKGEKSRNIITKGQNAQEGSPLLQPCLLGAKEMALLSSAGYADVEVSKKIRAGVLSTGSELCPAGSPLGAGKIYDSNGLQLACQLRQMGAEASFYGIVPDDFPQLLKTTALMAEENDVIILSGGISLGELDFTKKVFQSLQVEEIIHGVAVKPGKPLYFGHKNRKKAFFGVPGNPVSTFVCFEIFIKPYLYACMGLSYQAKVYLLPLHEAYTRKDAEREEYLPARLVQGQKGLEAQALAYKGSSMLPVLAGTEALIKVEAGKTNLTQGEGVHVRLLQ